MEISPEYLRDAAVEAVRAYLSEKKPLTASVVALALRDNLTGEQIKRVIETVNQVAYLRLLESAEDRTFEFPLASYEDVMAKILSPQEILEQDTGDSPLSLMKQAMFEGDDLEKSASEPGLESLSEGARLQLAYQAYQRTERMLEKVAADERSLVERLVGLADKSRGDVEFIDKVAFITDGDDETCRKISKLVFGQVKKASGQDLFYEEDLVDAKRIVGLLKQAEELVGQKKELEKSAQQGQSFFLHKAKKISGAVGEGLKKLKPTSLDVGIGALTYRPSNNIYQSLHKVQE